MLEKMIQAQTAKQAETLDRWLEKREREQIFPEGLPDSRRSLSERRRGLP